MTHGHGQAQHLLHLELDRVQKGVNLLLRILAVGDHRGELSSSVQTRSHDTRKLLDQRIGGQEGIVLLSQLTDQLLVLVQVRDLINVHARDSLLLADLLVLIVHEDAHVDVRSGRVGELERTRETLVLGRINLLQSHLELHSLHKVSLLSLQLLSVHLHLLSGRIVQNGVQCLAQNFAVNLAT